MQLSSKETCKPIPVARPEEDRNEAGTMYMEAQGNVVQTQLNWNLKGEKPDQYICEK